MRSSTSAIPAWSRSIRAGTRRRGASCRLGFDHILDGIDHLLFLFCLVLPFARVRPLVVDRDGVHGRAFDHADRVGVRLAPDALWFPPLIETLIAVSIVYMALENIVLAARPEGADRRGVSRRWIIAFGFGLVHGFGFSFALRETLQFAGVAPRHVALRVQRRRRARAVAGARADGAAPLRWCSGSSCRSASASIILSALVAHTAWHWMIERGSTLAKYEWWPPGPAGLATAIRLLMVVVAIAAVRWVWMRRRAQQAAIAEARE